MFQQSRHAFEALHGDDVNFIISVSATFGAGICEDKPLSIPFPNGIGTAVIVFPHQRINSEDRKAIGSIKPDVLLVEADGLFGKAGPRDFESAEWMIKRAEHTVLWSCGANKAIRAKLTKIIAAGRPITLVSTDQSHEVEWMLFIAKYRAMHSYMDLFLCRGGDLDLSKGAAK